MFLDVVVRSAAAQPTQVDLNGTNTTFAGVQSAVSTLRGEAAVTAFVARAPGNAAALVESYGGTRGGLFASTNNTSGNAGAVSVAILAASQGVTYSGSNYVSSTTAAWTAHHVGSFIQSIPASQGVPQNTRIAAVFLPASSGISWLASTAVVQGRQRCR